MSLSNFDLTSIFVIERLKEKAEEFFGCEYELFVEFTGLIRFVLLLFPPLCVKCRDVMLSLFAFKSNLKNEHRE